MLKMMLLLLAYAIAPIVAGHGILPMGLLLFQFQSPTWLLALAWSAIVAAVAGSIVPRAGSPARLLAQLASTIILYCAWLANILFANQFNAPAEQRSALESMLIFSLPFQISTVVVVYLLGKQLKRSRKSVRQ